MKMSWNNFKDFFLNQCLHLLWKQWSNLGVSGQTDASYSRIIDPEALLLTTTVFGRFDARLFDEMLDWLNLNGALINLQRLNNIQNTRNLADNNVLASISDTLGDRAVLRKWRDMGRILQDYVEPESLFILPDTSQTLPSEPHDKTFAKYGLVRGEIDLRGLSQRPNASFPSNLLMTLRALLGLNARCEILLYLLTHDHASAALIASQMYYYPRTIEKTLSEMALSDVVRLQVGTQKNTFWVCKEKWMSLLGFSQTISFEWLPWSAIFKMLQECWRVINQSGFQSASDMLQTSELRKIEKISTPVLIEAGLQHMAIHPQSEETVYLEAFQNQIRDLFKHLSADDALTD